MCLKNLRLSARIAGMRNELADALNPACFSGDLATPGATRPPDSLLRDNTRHIRPMPSRLSVVVVEKDRDRALLIVDALRDAGDHDVHVIANDSALARCVSGRNPDIVLVDMTSPCRDMIEQLTLVSGPLERPVAMFVDQTGAGLAKTAFEAGVSAYVVDGLRPDPIRAIFDAAVARFNIFQRMCTELTETRRGARGDKELRIRRQRSLAQHDTAKLADVLLPASGWGERHGTVTNSDRTTSRQRAILPPRARPAATGSNWQSSAGASAGTTPLPLTSPARQFASQPRKTLDTPGG